MNPASASIRRLWPFLVAALVAGCVTTSDQQRSVSTTTTPATAAAPAAEVVKLEKGKEYDPRMRPNPIRSDYRHDRWVTMPREIVRDFTAYVVSFDSKEDDGVAWGIPDWVAYEIKRFPGKLGAGPDRPDPWLTDTALAAEKIAPTDATYAYSQAFRSQNPDWYDRGHLCMKAHAWRLGADADWNTHITLNAVPQRAKFNQGIWQELEDLTAEWADGEGQVWIVAGPIVEGRKPKAYLGEKEKGEMLIAIPDALFKIVVRDTGGPRPDVLAFRFPQQHPKYLPDKPRDLAFFLVSVDEVEAATGLDFLTSLPDNIEREVERTRATKLWPVKPKPAIVSQN